VQHQNAGFFILVQEQQEVLQAEQRMSSAKLDTARQRQLLASAAVLS
jgi:hypothetical protein